MAVQTAWAVAFMVLAFAQCVPVRKQWHPEIEGTCVDRGAFYGYISLPNIIIDAVMLALPVPVIWKLQLKRNQKWILAPIFLIGST